MNPTKTIGRYRITYQNGIVQEKDLISHQDYLQIVKPNEAKMYDLQMKNKKQEAEKIKQWLISQFGERYFTDGSDMHKAIETGILTFPAYPSGERHYKTKVEKID